MTSRWPNSAKAAISFTMDNLGEAQDMYRKQWPHPIGTHPSIGTQLPRMLSLLKKHGIRATYFVESWSLGVYPSAIAAITAKQNKHDNNKSEKNKSENKGHEIAWHGYQHEAWTHLSPAEELDNFAKSFRAARDSGITYEGFRPPGGEVNERTWALLREHGVRYVSPAAGDSGVVGVGVGGEHEGIVVLPFEWRAVDAFYYMEKHGGGIVREPREFREYVMGRIDEVKKSGGFLSILAHPFLQTSEERFQVVEDILRRLAEDEEVWCAPCNQVASWVLEHRDRFESNMS